MIGPQPRDPGKRPVPVKDCVTCIHLARLRERASTAGDGSAVTDANVRLRRHQGEEHR
ncbi:hypothetical protein FNQ90_07875 [Streptomyces alkaliphilus]|uniref:Uncharacterized protein n=1 Tax=Streptomyces alkaliphilus TaxID=1472722 RepID=A0A7W3Y0V1_9ACTN|nr:hypothetical protein [Streptomyces alkaliphilus]MBB0244029.1 hypothetical protein [Streptomyces alkaliphilus]